MFRKKGKDNWRDIKIKIAVIKKQKIPWQIGRKKPCFDLWAFCAGRESVTLFTFFSEGDTLVLQCIYHLDACGLRDASIFRCNYAVSVNFFSFFCYFRNLVMINCGGYQRIFTCWNLWILSHFLDIPWITGD